jgi:hypothetical protein
MWRSRGTGTCRILTGVSCWLTATLVSRLQMLNQYEIYKSEQELQLTPFVINITTIKLIFLLIIYSEVIMNMEL